MKKSQNLTLLIGVLCVSATVLWSVVRSVLYYFESIMTSEWIRFFINNTLISSSVASILLILPLILLVRNLKGKNGKWLSIASAIVTLSFLGYEFYAIFGNLHHPYYLILSDASTSRLYFDVFMHYVRDGQLLVTVGCIFIIIGSALTLIKHNENRPHDS